MAILANQKEHYTLLLKVNIFSQDLAQTFSLIFSLLSVPVNLHTCHIPTSLFYNFCIYCRFLLSVSVLFLAMPFVIRLLESGVIEAKTGRVLHETRQGVGNDRHPSWVPKIRDLQGLN
jgi:hypothetical protein